MPYPSDQNKDTQRFAYFPQLRYTKIMEEVDRLKIPQFEEKIWELSQKVLKLPSLDPGGLGCVIKIYESEEYQKKI